LTSTVCCERSAARKKSPAAGADLHGTDHPPIRQESQLADHTAVFEREQTELAASTAPPTALLLGTALADVDLIAGNGARVTLSAATGERRAVLVLYRGAWCPHCNLALRTYQQDLVPALVERDIALIAVSPQLPDGSLSMRDRNELTFAVLSDPENRIASALGVLTGPSPQARAAQLELGLDLRAMNADGTTALPMPTVVILDPDRTIRWIDVRPDYSTRPTPRAILAALDNQEN
jgi:peroxiredoxin